MAEDHSTEQGAFWDTGEPLKRCTRCEISQPLGEFHFSTTRSGTRRRYSWCRSCRCAHHVAWNKKLKTEPEKFEKYKAKRRNGRMFRRFGITVEQYNLMHDEQNGLCAICQQPETTVHNMANITQLLAIDHDHETGKVRGLLCRACNQGLGCFREDIGNLTRAIEYLRKHQPSASA